MSLAGNLARILVDLKRIGLTDRDLGNELLRRFLERTPGVLGAWCVWEPDAFDGRDREFAGTPGHDATGRFVPLWHRYGGGVRLEPNTNYDKPGSGHWYLIPSLRAQEMVIDPYEYPIGGHPTLITTQAAPILDGTRCIGAAGIDISIDSLCAASPRRNVPPVSPLEQSLRRGHLLVGPQGEVRALSGYARRLLRRCAEPAGRRAALPGILRESFQRWHAAGNRPTRRKFEPLVRLGGEQLAARFSRHPDGECSVVVLELQPTPNQPATHACSHLSPRQLEVLSWLSAGKSNDEIALILGASPHTVKHHVEHIFQRLGVENRYAAASLFRDRESSPATSPPGSAYPL